MCVFVCVPNRQLDIIYRTTPCITMANDNERWQAYSIAKLCLAVDW